MRSYNIQTPSASDRLNRQHNSNNYLYKHKSEQFISNCGLTGCPEIVEPSNRNPLARKQTPCPTQPSLIFDDIKSQSQYLNHYKQCGGKCSDDSIHSEVLGTKHSSYHRHISAVTSKVMSLDVPS